MPTFLKQSRGIWGLFEEAHIPQVFVHHHFLRRVEGPQQTPAYSRGAVAVAGPAASIPSEGAPLETDGSGTTTSGEGGGFSSSAGDGGGTSARCNLLHQMAGGEAGTTSSGGSEGFSPAAGDRGGASESCFLVKLMAGGEKATLVSDLSVPSLSRLLAELWERSLGSLGFSPYWEYKCSVDIC